MNSSEEATEAKCSLGDRIRWNTLSREIHGIVLAYVPKGTIKRISKSELTALATCGVIPKHGISARREFKEERAGNNRYIVLKFSLGSGWTQNITIADIQADKDYEPSQYLLNSQWLVYRQRKRKALLAEQRAKKGEA